MTESEYLAELKSKWPSGHPVASMDILAVADNAVRAFPDSAQLWHLRGELIWMAPPYCLYDALDALLSHERAVEIDPSLADAHDRIGDYYDGIKDDPKTALIHYHKAEQIRANAAVQSGIEFREGMKPDGCPMKE